jgi:Steroid receptor RNA activator (SRA1)
MSGPSPSAPTAPTTLMPLLPTAGAPPPQMVFSVPQEPVVSEAKLEDVLDIFKGRLKENESKGDVFKRLQAMATSWEEGKLNQDVCQRLKKMAELLTEGDTDAAESVRVSLAVDYSAECAGWIMAFKHIINAGGE